MAEYIEREALFAKFDRMGLGEHSLVEKIFSDGVRTIIAAMPAADVVPVVRCRDCKWDRPDKLLNKHWCTRIFGCTEVREDDFCSCGRRKEDAP